jgi:hypothetical protein
MTSRGTFGALPKSDWKTQLKVAARRYLCEYRDEAQPLIHWISSIAQGQRAGLERL